MPKIQYITKRFSEGSLATIAEAVKVVDRYQSEGYSLTLRQLYYRLVAAIVIKNNLKEYKRLGSLISDARRAGIIDWDMIEDRTRNLQQISTWSSPQSVIDSAASSYREDLWRDQDVYVEVWFEKDALMGVFERVAQEVRVPFFSCRGYTSDSEMWGASQRLAAAAEDGKAVTILHFGDHDPSGRDMTRDIKNRLHLFRTNATMRTFDVNRLALNMDQIEQYSPPPNPAKVTDSRYEEYMQEFGTESWELDALEPNVLAGLVRDEINLLVDPDKWADAKQSENEERQKLRQVARRWGELPLTEDEIQVYNARQDVVAKAKQLWWETNDLTDLSENDLEALRDSVNELIQLGD